MVQAGEEPWRSLVPALITPGLTVKLDRLVQGHIQFQKSPRVEILQPLGARDAMQVLCHGERDILSWYPFPR